MGDVHQVQRNFRISNCLPSFVAVDTADKNSLHAIQNPSISKTFFGTHDQMHIIFVVQTIFVDELFHAMTLIVNDGCPLWRERLVIPFVRTGCAQTAAITSCPAMAAMPGQRLQSFAAIRQMTI